MLPLSLGAAEFITAIYYLPVYQRNVIPLRVSDAWAALPLLSITWGEGGVCDRDGAGGC